MKKILCAALAFSLCMGSVVGVYANSNNDEVMTESVKSILLTQDNDGCYITADKKDANIKTAKKTKDKDVYSLSDGSFLIQTTSETYQNVERFEVQLSNKQAVAKLLENQNISDDEKTMITEQSKIALTNNNKDARVVVFLPKNNLTRATGTNSYTYKGYNLQDQWTYYYGMQTTWVDIATGSKASNVAKSVLDLSVIATGIAYEPIGLFSSAVSAYQAFVNGCGSTPINGSYDDKLQANIRYDIYTKRTFVKGTGGYLPKLVTQQATITQIKTSQYYMTNVGGKTVDTVKETNKIYKTKNFDNPAPYSISHGMTSEEVKAKIYNKPINF